MTSSVVKAFTEIDVPRLTRNVLSLAVGGMALYLLFTTISSMSPYMMQVAPLMGTVLGFMIPLAFMAMVFGIVIGVVRAVSG